MVSSQIEGEKCFTPEFYQHACLPEACSCAFIACQKTSVPEYRVIVSGYRLALQGRNSFPVVDLNSKQKMPALKVVRKEHTVQGNALSFPDFQNSFEAAIFNRAGPADF